MNCWTWGLAAARAGDDCMRMLCSAANRGAVVLCRDKVKASGDAGLPPLVAIVTDAGSASKEQGNFIIKDAANTSMNFWGSPFR